MVMGCLLIQGTVVVWKLWVIHLEYYIFSGAMMVLYQIAKQKECEAPWIPVDFALSFICINFVNVRPTMVTVLLLSLQILVVERFSKNRKRAFLAATTFTIRN